MRYFVVVNQKYIVAVDSSSNGGAEHVVLDNVYGVLGAQAFDGKDINTDTFRWFMDNCETISLAELAKKGDVYREKVDEWAEASKKREYIASRIDSVMARLEELKIALADADSVVREKCSVMADSRSVMGI